MILIIPNVLLPHARNSATAATDPQDELEIEVIGHMGTVVGLADGHSENGIGDHPGDDHVRAHAAVIVLLLLEFAHAILFNFEPVAEVTQRFVVAGIDVELLRGHFELDGVALGADGGAEVNVDDVVAFGTPGDVVGVAEGVDLQGADVGGEEGEVLG